MSDDTKGSYYVIVSNKLRKCLFLGMYSNLDRISSILSPNEWPQVMLSVVRFVDSPL